MSKNFELLQQLEEARLASTSIFAPSEQNTPDLSVAQESTKGLDVEVRPRPDTSAPTLTMDDFSRKEIAKLVQRLFLLPGSVRNVVFAGVDPGTGCTWTVSRAAEVLAAQVVGSVCVVDANFHSPTLHSVFSVTNHLGLSDALAQPGPLRQFTCPLRSNLSLLSVGSAAISGRDALLNSELLRARFNELRAEFDYVLIDAAALSLCSDSVAMGHLTDGVALIVEADVTRREATRKAAQELESAKIRLMGMVLNKRTFPIPENLYKRL